MILRNYYKQLYVNKLDHLEEMSKFLEIQPTKTEWWWNRNLNRPITSKEIKSIIKKPLNKQKSGPDSFTDELYKHSKNN